MAQTNAELLLEKLINFKKFISKINYLPAIYEQLKNELISQVKIAKQQPKLFVTYVKRTIQPYKDKNVWIQTKCDEFNIQITDIKPADKERLRKYLEFFSNICQGD